MSGEDILGIIGGCFGIIIVLSLIPALQESVEQIGEHQHPGYESTIKQQNQTIQELRQYISSLEKERNNLSRKYERLVQENVTKKDINEITHKLNKTNKEIEILNKRFNTINKQYLTAYQKTVQQYQFWFSLSLLSFSFIGFELLIQGIFGNSVIEYVVQKLKSLMQKINGNS